jgi:hypothetical protein
MYKTFENVNMKLFRSFREVIGKLRGSYSEVFDEKRKLQGSYPEVFNVKRKLRGSYSEVFISIHEF